MELKNIHNRKEFVKIYELIGGTSGGVGDKDGFANNASLKDTLLGKLVNGIFRGIGWLWRKSKESPLKFENDYFVLYGKKYSYNGLKIQKINKR